MWYLGNCELCNEYKPISYQPVLNKDICQQCVIKIQAAATPGPSPFRSGKPPTNRVKKRIKQGAYRRIA